jgi:hypothetical protein
MRKGEGTGRFHFHGAHWASGIVVDDTFVFLATPNGIERIGKADSTLSVITPSQYQVVFRIALDANRIYASSRMTADGGTVSALVSIDKNGNDDHIIWSGDYAQAATDFVIDEANLYFTGGTPGPSSRVAKDGMSPATSFGPFIGTGYFGTLSQDTNFVYGEVFDPQGTRIYRKPKAGGPDELIVQASTGAIVPFAGDGQRVYWKSGLALFTAPTTGGNEVILATIPPASPQPNGPDLNAYGLATDNDYVYWTERGPDWKCTGRVRRIRKPAP